jgi:hypothetical protein
LFPTRPRSILFPVSHLPPMLRHLFMSPLPQPQPQSRSHSTGYLLFKQAVTKVCSSKVQVKLFLCLTTTIWRRMELKVHVFLTSHLMGVSGQLHAQAALSPGKNCWYQLDRRFGGPQNRSGRVARRKILEPAGNRTHKQPLYWLSCPPSWHLLTFLHILLLS